MALLADLRYDFLAEVDTEVATSKVHNLCVVVAGDDEVQQYFLRLALVILPIANAAAILLIAVGEGALRLRMPVTAVTESAGA